MTDSEIIREIARIHLVYVAHYGTRGSSIAEELRVAVSDSVGINLPPRTDALAEYAKELLRIHFQGNNS